MFRVKAKIYCAAPNKLYRDPEQEKSRLTACGRSGVFYTQSYCLQALFNLTRNREFAKTIVDHDLMEDFIVASMVHSNGRVVTIL